MVKEGRLVNLVAWFRVAILHIYIYNHAESLWVIILWNFIGDYEIESHPVNAKLHLGCLITVGLHMSKR